MSAAIGEFGAIVILAISNSLLDFGLTPQSPMVVVWCSFGLKGQAESSAKSFSWGEIVGARGRLPQGLAWVRCTTAERIDREDNQVHCGMSMVTAMEPFHVHPDGATLGSA